MTLTSPASSTVQPSGAAKRVGYLVAVIVNALMLFVVNNLYDWDLFAFLTKDFDRVVPIISISLVRRFRQVY